MKFNRIIFGILISFVTLAEVSLPEFTTINNTKFSQKDLKGYWITNVFFSSCTGICPILMANIKKVSNKFPNIKIVSISVDPKRDTMETLKTYRKKLEIKNLNWLFLLSDLEKIKIFIGDQLKITTNNNPDLHSTRITLLKDNQIVEYYQGLDPQSLDKLEKKLASLN